MLESQKKAIEKYQKQNTKVYTFRLNKKTDPGLIEYLDSLDNKQAFIKSALLDKLPKKPD